MPSGEECGRWLLTSGRSTIPPKNWRASGASVEFHLYSAGGHGFASQPHGTTSDAWFDQYALWLKAMKLTP